MYVQQQEQAAFEQAFAEASGAEAPAVATTAAPEGAVAAETPEPVADPGAAEPETSEQPEAAEPGKVEPAEQYAANPEDDDPVLLDGLKRSELRRLLGNAADVESIKRQLDKAHGSIGELNRRLQQSAPPAAAATPAPQVPELPPNLKQFEADYPEVAEYVRALGITPQLRPETPSADAQPAQAEVQSAQVGPDPLAVELAVMDRMHAGWREKLGSQEFSMWMASQDEKVRQTFDTAQTADVMSSVLGQFEQWASARTAAADKAAKGQQRLQKAVTPTGNASRPQSAPTELDAMEAAFKRVLGQ